MSEVNCGSAFEPGGSSLPYYCKPPVCVPAVLGALPVCWLWTNKKKSEKGNAGWWWQRCVTAELTDFGIRISEVRSLCGVGIGRVASDFCGRTCLSWKKQPARGNVMSLLTGGEQTKCCSWVWSQSRPHRWISPSLGSARHSCDKFYHIMNPPKDGLITLWRCTLTVHERTIPERTSTHFLVLPGTLLSITEITEFRYLFY